MSHCALPSDPLTPNLTAFQVIDTLVDAILDAPTPSTALAVTSRLKLSRGYAEPVIQVRIGNAFWELSTPSWARVLTDVARRAKLRHGHMPSIVPALDVLLDGGMAAIRSAHAFDLRTAH